MFQLAAENCADYLRRGGHAPPGARIDVETLAGGVSNIVLKASWDGGDVVIKQSLPHLRVEADWQFDQARILIERDCLLTLHELIPRAAPQVVFCDEPLFILGMTLAPEGGIVWRDQLAASVVETSTILHVAQLLALMQTRSAMRSTVLSDRFGDLMPLYQGRIYPFHHEVARRHPELREPIKMEIARLVSTREVLVHGDFSPKNLIAYPDRVLLLDCEVAHWGDPAFDAAFLLCHLLLDGLKHSGPTLIDVSPALLAWAQYRRSGGLATDSAVVAELGCIMMARVDGKSPLPNIPTTAHDQIRGYGAYLLTAPPRTVDSAITTASDFLAK